MDADYKFKESCRQSAQEVWDESLSNIKSGNSNKYWEDRLSEACDSSVPSYTHERWSLVEYLDESWDEAKNSKTLDDALGMSIYLKSSEYHHEFWEELGGEEKLDELEQVMSEWTDALSIYDQEAISKLLKNNANELRELGLDITMPSLEKLEYKFTKSSYN